MELKEVKKLVSEVEEPHIVSCRCHVPYEGYWWEMNYWLFKEGQFYPLYVSGKIYNVFGFNEKSKEEILTEGIAKQHYFDIMESSTQYDTWDVEALSEIKPDYNSINNMTAIVETYHGLQGPVWECNFCQKEHHGIAHFLGSYGNGGVGSLLSTPCCDNCFNTLRWCLECTLIVMPEDGKCPVCSSDRFEPLCDEDDEAKGLRLDGSAFLAPGALCGPKPVVVILTKKEEDAKEGEES